MPHILCVNDNLYQFQMSGRLCQKMQIFPIVSIVSSFFLVKIKHPTAIFINVSVLNISKPFVHLKISIAQYAVYNIYKKLPHDRNLKK